MIDKETESYLLSKSRKDLEEYRSLAKAQAKNAQLRAIKCRQDAVQAEQSAADREDEVAFITSLLKEKS